ncbi:putative secreted protein (Por secretion system target) [Dyadobacter jejuensis]|uniref:Putative secreted protein (Por secretion system target) n=1 Tax=Dyadobacter jejuensis TaxID=1082580 RepID=A0A316AMJ1_9BACT|nr:T9SS type A sorting domain-containing protein [Dyadobacter jejuensis]PWJ58995.1 putative secreted protein (Por secretion system target) [Dyadobacter jejuensis]
MKRFKQFLYLGSMLLLMAANSRDRLATARTAAAQLECEGIVWTHGEYLGDNGGYPVYTLIKDNRIYISRNEGNDPNHTQAFHTSAILYHLSNNRFPISQYQSQIDNCVNGSDPSTSTSGYLGATTNEGIYCNGKLIRDDQYLGDYIGGDGVHTLQYTRIKDGLLRVNLWRQQNGSVRDPNSFNMALIEPALSGENGSFFNWGTLGYSLNIEEFRGCFFSDTPKYGNPVGVSNDCASGPSLTSVYNITNTSLAFNFTGSGITSLNWSIKSDGNVVSSGNNLAVTGGSAAISYGSLVNGNYVLEIEGGNCSSAVSAMAFTINVPVGSVDCGRGPTITALSNISQTALTFQFDGDGVPNIDWRITSNGNLVRSGRTPQLTSSVNNISFASLDYGTYTFEIEGGDCNSSVSSQVFEIVNPSGSNNCSSGPTIEDISAITATSLQVTFTGAGVTSLGWRILSSGSQVRSGTSNVSGNTASMNFASLTNGNYTLEIEGSNCSSSVSTRDFVINVLGSTPPCGRGPSVTSINNPGATSLQFQFDGDGVPNIDWSIKSAGSVVASGRTPDLTSNVVNISYSHLNDGEYALELQGGDCTSSPNSAVFTIGSALPIHITRFEGKAVEAGVELSWNVVQEENGQGFEVLRLHAESKTMTTLGFVSLSDQALGDYSFMDSNPNLGQNYYQLKQLDLDGSFIMSRVIAVNNENIVSASLSPNPARQSLHLKVYAQEAGTAQIETFNLAGIKLITKETVFQKGINTILLDIASLQEGQYFIRLYQDNQASTYRFLKIN